MYAIQGDILRKTREKLGYSLATASNKIGITINYLSLIERGKRKPSNTVLLKISNVYDLTLKDLQYQYGKIPEEHLKLLLETPKLTKILTQISIANNLTPYEIEELCSILKEAVIDIINKRKEQTSNL